MASFLAKTDCAYLHALCSLFPMAEARDDFQALTTLASIIKAIVLLNDPDIIECIVSDEILFEKCCCCLEYDPDLRDKANHRWFIRHRLRFRTVILMEVCNLTRLLFWYHFTLSRSSIVPSPFLRMQN
jgi:protein phosphatase-4 regulatory subunit 3